MIKGKGTWIHIYVQDLTTGTGKTGDNANLIGRIISDSSHSAPTNGFAQVDAVNAPGWYRIQITAAENVGEKMSLAVRSTTADVACAGASWTNEHNAAAIGDSESVADNVGSKQDQVIADVGTRATQVSLDALQSTVDGLAVGVSTRVQIATHKIWEIPDSGATEFLIVILTVDTNGTPVDPGQTPTFDLVEVDGTSATSLFSGSVTNPSTGRYEQKVSIASTETQRPLVFSASATFGGETHTGVCLPQIADTVAVDFTAADRTVLSDLSTRSSEARLAVLDRVDGLVEDSGGDRFTSKALEQAPSGGGGGGGNVDEDAIASLVLAGLGSLSVEIVNPVPLKKTKPLILVQRADYKPTSLIGPLRIKIESSGVQAGDDVRFGATCEDQTSIQASGTVVDLNGEMHAEIALTKEDHTDREPSAYWRWELEHVNADGDVSPLYEDREMILLPSHAEGE